MNVRDAPVCPGGRCASVLEALAKANATQLQRNGVHMANVMRRAARVLGVDAAPAAVDAALAQAVIEVTGISADEATAYLAEATGLDLADGDVAALEARTEGWIASLQLAALSLRGRADPAFQQET